MTGASESVREERSKNLLVSVIIPVYQVSDYVERCLLSVMNQTYQNIECIIVDDCSTDDSIDKCERLISSYNGPIKFRILHHKVNRGLSAARNTGTVAAKGEYIFYIDSDDEITRDCIEKLTVVTREHPNAEMVIGNTRMFDIDGNESLFLREGMPSFISSNDKIVVFYHNQLIPIGAWNRLIKRSFLIENNLYFKEGVIFEDYLWMFYLVKYLSIVFFVNDVTYYYYRRPGSISTGSDTYTIGFNYSLVFDDILHHLTPGRECMEMSRYVDRYTKCYLSYKSIVSNYNDLHRLFKERAYQYHCWYVRLVLSIVGVVGRLGIPISFLEKINIFRWKLKKKM